VKVSEPAGASEKRLLFVVSRSDLDRYDYLKKAFRDEPRIAVILDRRRAERRWRELDRSSSTERRRADRRKFETADHIKSLGWALIRQP
jgi:hypothetical protein